MCPIQTDRLPYNENAMSYFYRKLRPQGFCVSFDAILIVFFLPYKNRSHEKSSVLCFNIAKWLRQ